MEYGEKKHPYVSFPYSIYFDIKPVLSIPPWQWPGMHLEMHASGGGEDWWLNTLTIIFKREL